MSNNAPRTVRELYFYCQGEFETLNSKLDNMKKITWWVGGLTGGIITGILIGFFKVIKWIK